MEVHCHREFVYSGELKKGHEGTTLARALQKTGIVAEKNASLSERVCLPCFTKIRKTSEGFSFVAATLNVVNPKFALPESEIEESDVAPGIKRTLPTSVTTPDRSPGQRKIARCKGNQKEKSGARKS